TYARMEQGIAVTGWLMSVVAGLAVLLAAGGIYFIWRAVARPLAEITRIIEVIAAGGGENGELDAVLPLGKRNDEIGAFARSLAVFRQTMRWNSELNRTVTDDAQQRKQQQDRIAAEIGRFGKEVEATLAELAAIAEQMLAASGHLAGAADNA